MMNMYDDAMGRVNSAQLGHTKSGVIGTSPPVERDPDSVENLLAQVFSQVIDNKDVLSGVRVNLLGSWPEAATEIPNKSSDGGLISQMKSILYRIMDANQEIREHINAIAKGVR